MQCRWTKVAFSYLFIIISANKLLHELCSQAYCLITGEVSIISYIPYIYIYVHISICGYLHHFVCFQVYRIHLSLHETTSFTSRHKYFVILLLLSLCISIAATYTDTSLSCLPHLSSCEIQHL